MQRSGETVTPDTKSTRPPYKDKRGRIRRWSTPNLFDPRREWVAFDPFRPREKRELSYWGLRKGGWLEV